MEQFMERFEENLRKYLEPVEVGKVYYYFSLDLNALHIVIFPENQNEVLGVDMYSTDETGNRSLVIGNRFYSDKTKLDAESIFQKFLDAVKLDFQVKDEINYRDEDYWRIEKGSFLIEKKE